MSSVYTVVAVVLLLFLIYANVDVDSPPLDPRQKILKRHVWRMIQQAAERELDSQAPYSRPRDEPNDRPEPQAKWSDRR